MEKTVSGVWVELKQNNLDNSHFYLAGVASFFPDDSMKSFKDEPLTVSYEPGPTVSTLIDPKHRFFRDRASIAEFFRLSGAAAGDWVVIQSSGKRTYRVTLRKNV